MGNFDELTGRARSLRADAARAAVNTARAGRRPEDLAQLAQPARRNRVADDAAWASARPPRACAWKRGVLGDTVNADGLAKLWLRTRRPGVRGHGHDAHTPDRYPRTS